MKRIVLLTRPALRMLEGLARYATADRGWVIEQVEPSGGGIEALCREPPDGIIAYVNHHNAEIMGRLTCPVVNHSGALAHSPFTRVCCDDAAMGRLGARHLMDRGFSQLAVLCYETFQFSIDRVAGFTAEAEAAGLTAHHLPIREPEHNARNRSQREDEAIIAWLRGFGFPLGVMCVNDEVAWRLAMLCHEAGINVPEQVAVLGIGNTAGICDLSHPRLSSVIAPWDQVGYHAAEMLDGLMRGESPKQDPARIAPLGIETRRSTDVLAIADPKIAAALRFIRERAHRGISIPEVAEAAGLPRRSLEQRFQALLQRTPLEEINRVKVQLVKDLLADPVLSLEQIASRAGYDSVRWMSRKFKEDSGQTPAAWRRRRQ